MDTRLRGEGREGKGMEKFVTIKYLLEKNSFGQDNQGIENYKLSRGWISRVLILGNANGLTGYSGRVGGWYSW